MWLLRSTCPGQLTNSHAQGARLFYVNVLRPIMSQSAKSTKGSYAAPETATADDLRAKVHTATEY